MEDYGQMTASCFFGIARFAGSCALVVAILALQVEASSIKRLYVEPFNTESGSEKLRSDVLTELRKVRSVSLVSDQSQADMVLGGGGGIWIKGYRSLNPRSGRLPSDGTPVYDGYLSVELRDNKARRFGPIWPRLETLPKTSPRIWPSGLPSIWGKHSNRGICLLKQSPSRNPPSS